MLEAIAKLPVTDEERAAISGLNAAKLLGITVAGR
jgi:predicted TIM-barrel fold metal-dependent hydrolase